MSAWGAIAQGVGQMATAGLTMHDNAQTRKDQMSLNDRNIRNQWDMWNATNAYNTPMEQRKRLELAGFNPNMAVGGMVNVASNQNLPDNAPVEARNTGQAVGEAINNIVGYQMQEKQMRDLEASAKLKDEQKNNVLMDIAGKGIENARNEFELNMAKNLSENTVNKSNESLKNQRLKNQWQEIENLNITDRHKMLMLESVNRIEKIATEKKGVELDNALKAEVLRLRKMGIEINDNILLRMFHEQVSDIKGGIDKGWDFMKMHRAN